MDNLCDNTALIQQFHAQCLPQEITSILDTFFVGNNNSAQFEIGENLTENLASTDPQSSSDGCFESEKPSSVDKLKEEIEIQSVVDLSGNVPENFSDCTEYFDEYFHHGCGCSKMCHRKFPKTLAFKAHLDALALDQYCPQHVNHQHLLLLGALNSLMPNRSKNRMVHKHKPDLIPEHPSEQDSQGQISRPTTTTTTTRNSSTSYKFMGEDVCRNFFAYVFGCGERRLKNLTKHFLANGVDCVKHESVYNNSLNKINSERRRHDALVFMQNFAQQNSLQLPGRYSRSENQWLDLYLLPKNADCSRRHVYDQYHGGCLQMKHEPISFALWNELWDLHYPNIQTYQKRSEPCLQCRRNKRTLQDPRPSESSQLVAVQRYMSHLDRIKRELDHYEKIVKHCTTVYEDYSQRQSFETNLQESFRSTLKTMHYTLNWFHTISLPHDPGQSRLLFKNGYKVGLFGIAVEPYRKFILYIIPEFLLQHRAMLINLLISLLHHFFSTYRFGEQESFIHLANNRLGQLKNSLLISYMMWRTVWGKHDRFHLSYLPDGHTYCWNDLFLGVFMKKFRNCHVESILDVKSIAERCCIDQDEGLDMIQDPMDLGPRGGHVQTYVVGDDCQQVLLPLYDWCTKLSLIQSLPANLLRKYNHFTVDIEMPGQVICQECAPDFADNPQQDQPAATETHRLWNADKSMSKIDETLPKRLNLAPTSQARRSYLHDAVGPFVANKNLEVFHLPAAVAKCTGQDDPKSPATAKSQTRKNRQPKCSYCQRVGHREKIFGKVSCPQKRKDLKILQKPKNVTTENVATETLQYDEEDHQTEELMAIIDEESQNLVDYQQFHQDDEAPGVDGSATEEQELLDDLYEIET